MAERINVTRALLPDEDDFHDHLREIFASRVLTNNGELTRRLERELGEFLGTPYLILCANGTIALELCLHAAKAAGKTVITTPFTYVATASAPLWTGCRVVFADIDPETLAIDPEKIAEKMGPDIAAILPVDIYGHPCDFKKISHLAGDVPVIYDAAQAFGSRLDGKSLFEYGDYATCSLHATKVFHTFEGGFVVCRDSERLERLKLLRAFGHCGDAHVCLGINAKMSEAHAAMGLSLLGEFQTHRLERKRLSALYDALLVRDRLRTPTTPCGFESNYAYYPVIFETETMLSRVMDHLARKNVHPRRYFYPALTTLPYITGQSCPVAEDVARRVLCLPLYSGLEDESVAMIAETVNQASA